MGRRSAASKMEVDLQLRVKAGSPSSWQITPSAHAALK
jgi:hypothetical protein